MPSYEEVKRNMQHWMKVEARLRDEEGGEGLYNALLGNIERRSIEAQAFNHYQE